MKSHHNADEVATMRSLHEGRLFIRGNVPRCGLLKAQLNIQVLTQVCQEQNVIELAMGNMCGTNKQANENWSRCVVGMIKVEIRRWNKNGQEARIDKNQARDVACCLLPAVQASGGCFRPSVVLYTCIYTV